MLIKLSNGGWVRSDKIEEIRPMAEEGAQTDRVILLLTGPERRVLPCVSLADAQAQADAIANAVNASPATLLLKAVAKEVAEYHHHLDLGAETGEAAERAMNNIEVVLDRPWVEGAEKKRRGGG